MKKLLYLLIFFLLLGCFAGLTVPVGAISEINEAVKSVPSGLHYSVGGGEAIITRYTGSAKILVIPDTIKGYPVTIINSYAFQNCTSLTHVTIPDSVTSIGDGAFYNCESLTSITIPDSVTSIYANAFQNCTSLTSITIPDSVTSIEDYVFWNCTSLTSITIPDSVTSIGFNAFLYCSSLTSVTIPDSVTSIGYDAFSGCTSLTSITIGDSVTSIGRWAFSDCSSLTSITIGNSVTSIEDYVFRNCTSLTSITIPDSVTGIGSSAFYNCGIKKLIVADGSKTVTSAMTVCSSTLEEVIIPDSVTSIGSGAFYNCSSLTSITIPDSVTSIGSGAFYNCSSLTSVTIGDSVTSISSSAFSGCSSLTSITIPDSVTSIGSYAFSGCSSLTSITIGNSVTSIEDYVFRNCSSLTSITIPDSVTSIGSYAFDDCSKLKTIYYYGTRSQWGQIISASGIGANNAIIYYLLDTASPTVSERTKTTVTLVAIAGYEYSMNGIDWQSSNVFTDLEPATQYSFYQRIAATTATAPGKTSSPLTVITSKHTVAAPEKPVLAEYTANSVTLQKFEGYEYSKNGSTWQSSNVFTGLAKQTKYTFYQRIAETNTTKASSASEPLDVRTPTKNVCSIKPAKPIVASYTDTRVDLVARAEYEYSKDGKTWQSSAYFGGLSPNTKYTFYQRLKETDTEFASAASIGITVTTAPGAELSTASNYDRLVNYINQNGVTEFGYKRVKFTQTSSGGKKYNFYLDIRSNGVYCYVDSTIRSSSSSMYTASGILLKRADKNIVADMEINLYSYDYGVSSDFNTSATINRSTHTTKTVIPLSNAEVGSQYSNLYHDNLNYLLSTLSLYFYDNLGFSIGGLGFFAFEEEVTGNTSYRYNYCDPATNYHRGSNVLYNKREVSCISDGYTGDYHCSVCKEKVKTGSIIKATGTHKYTNSCDKDCNTCGEERRITHTYSGYCDKDCNVCGTRRTVLLDHYYGNGTSQNSTNHIQVCTGCGVTKVSAHSWNEGAVTQEPTCNANGVCTYTCVGCPHTKTESIPAAHNFSDWVKVNEDTHTHTCDLCKKTETKPHTWDSGEITQKPTDDAPGLMLYTCTGCGATKVIEVDFLPGDVTGDLKINSLDGLMLLRYLNGWNVNIPSPNAMDVNGDGKVNSLDGLILMRYLNGWNVTIG